MNTLMLDTHVVHWWADEPERLSPAAAAAIAAADEIAVAGPTWFELAWLLTKGRLNGRIPLRAWLDQLSRGVRTMPLTAAVAARAAELPEAFPRDPADRIIYATAVENGLRLVTRDRRMRQHDPTGTVVIW